MSAPRSATTNWPVKPHTGTTATAVVPVANQAALDPKASGALLALVRLLARQAAAEVVRSGLTPASDSGATQ